MPTLVVRREGQEDSDHTYFLVRRAHVSRVLFYLKVNNLHYSDIVIDAGALSHLPQNGQLPGLFEDGWDGGGFRVRHRALTGKNARGRRG